jgi:3-deoxy-manno-octulosonate cytidylyltransferase (CMP-KDO synthetase)
MPSTPDYLLVIPARYESGRLPGKPLLELLGVPLVHRTWHQCTRAVPPELIYVATDDERIFGYCRDKGIRVAMTPADCLTGTDRIAAFAKDHPAGLYINVQGDEPVIDPEDIAKVLTAARERPGEVINGMCEITDEALFRNPSIPKLVTRPDGRLLYMSRAPIPTTKRLLFEKAWRQICIYAFPPDALARFAAMPSKSPLEAFEDIEILRFLEMGFEVRMIPLSDSSVAVDTPEDISRAEEAIRARGLEKLS